MAVVGAGEDVLIGATGMVAGAGVAVGVEDGAVAGMEDGTVAGMEDMAAGTVDIGNPFPYLT